MSIPRRSFLRSALLTPLLLTSGCSRDTTVLLTPTLSPPFEPDRTSAPSGHLTLLGPLTLDKRTVSSGKIITGSVTYANQTTAPITIRNVVIASRPGSGLPSNASDTDFSPGGGVLTIDPGKQVTLIASRTLSVVAEQQPWLAFTSYQGNDGVWHDSPAESNLIFTVVADGASPDRSPVARPVPSSVPLYLDTPTPLYWGAFIDRVPWDLTILDAFEARAGRATSMIHWGQSWWRDGRYQPFYAGDFARVRARGAIPLLTWGSWDDAEDENQPRFGLAGIARGEHDAYLRSWAAGAAAWGHPLFLRFNWEMNGWWQFPWSAQLNGNTAGDYVAAWRHVREVFEATGATNVTWVWCPNVVSKETTPLAALYPGDAYVDWVALDGYNWGTDYGNRWQTFTEVYLESYSALRQLAPTKPIMIAEIGSQENGGDKAAWIKDALGTQLPVNFPAIKALAWFNWDANDPIQVASIESSASASAAFGATVRTSPFFLPNRFADLSFSPIPPPGPGLA